MIAKTDQCDHPRQVITHRAFGSGIHYGRQCLDCGGYAAVKKATLTEYQLSEAVPFNPEIGRQFWSRRSEEYQKLRIEQDAERKAKYEEYLQSDAWKKKRERVMERDNYQCQACLKRPAVDVHHKTYEHIFNEPLFDLVAVCRVCHEAIHCVGK